MKSKSLQDLDAMRKKLADDAKAQERAEQARVAAEKRAEAERNLFTRAVGKVAPISQPERVWSPPQRPLPRPIQQDLDDEAVMHESMSDEFDITTLLDADDQLSFRRSGIGTDVTRKLRKGEWSIQGQIDLHGLRSDEARNAIGQFIRDAMCACGAWQGTRLSRQRACA